MKKIKQLVCWLVGHKMWCHIPTYREPDGVLVKDFHYDVTICQRCGFNK